MTIKVAFYSVKKTQSSKLQTFLSNFEVPFSFAYIKSYIDKYLPGVAEFEVIRDINELDAKKIDIIGFSAYTDCFNQLEDLAKKAKELNPEIFSIVGSYHISALPYTLPLSVDCGVIGEGEETFKKILEVMVKERSRPLPTDNLKKINGLVFRENGNFILTPRREPIEPLDKIPPPDRNIIDVYPSLIKESISTSRGCPYNCKFCAGNVTWGNSRYRYFSAEYVVAELESMVKNLKKWQTIQIIDDLFIVNKARLYEIAKGIEYKCINQQVDFIATVRANLIDDEMCRILDRMNVRMVSFGAESSSLKLLNSMNKQTTPQNNQLTLDFLYKYNIKANCSFIFGIPGETAEDMYNTFDFIIRNKRLGKIEGVGVYALTPFPGTYYWEMAKEKGLVSENMDFSKLAEMLVTNIPGVYSFDEWRTLREGYSVYLNNENVEESKFYDLLKYFFNELTPLLLGRGRI